MRQENNNSNNHVYYIIYVIVLFLIVAMFITWRWFVMPKVYESPKIYNHYVWNPDSIKSDMIVCPDSVSLEKYLEHIDSISRVAIQKADNYISDVDLMISKSSAWMGMWLGIFAIIMTVPTIIQFVMTYRNESRMEKMIDDGKNEARLLETKLKCSIKEHRISSIMMCMSSIPDPQLTPSQEEKRQFVNHYIKFLSREFEDYINLLSVFFEKVKLLESTDEQIERNNILMVITMLKMSLIRTQCVFSDVTQNVQYHSVKSKLDEVYYAVQSGEVWNGDLIGKFRDVDKEFIILISALEG